MESLGLPQKDAQFRNECFPSVLYTVGWATGRACKKLGVGLLVVTS